MYSGISTLLYTELGSIAISLKALSMFSGDRSLEWILNLFIVTLFTHKVLYSHSLLKINIL